MNESNANPMPESLSDHTIRSFHAQIQSLQRELTTAREKLSEEKAAYLHELSLFQTERTEFREKLEATEKERDKWITNWDNFVKESSDYCEKWTAARNQLSERDAELKKANETIKLCSEALWKFGATLADITMKGTRDRHA